MEKLKIARKERGKVTVKRAEEKMEKGEDREGEMKK